MKRRPSAKDPIRVALDALEAIGSPEDGRDAPEILADLEAALGRFEAVQAEEALANKLAASWGEIHRRKAAVLEQGGSEIAPLRKAIRATRALYGISALPSLPAPDARVLARARSGPLLHVATGLSTLDAITGGGLLAGRVAVIGGQPDSGKTSLAVQIGYHAARNGLAVAIHCVDEDVEGIQGRIGQQASGLRLEDLENRDEHALDQLAQLLRRTPNLLFVDQEDDGLAVEDTAAMLDALALQHRCHGKVLIVDSLQTARSRAFDAMEEKRRNLTPKDRADVITATLKSIARRSGALVIVTSELARGAYRARRAQDRTAPMASFKESGAVEYAMWIGLVLTTLRGEPNMVCVQVPKNKRGRSRVAFKLERDPARCSYTDLGMIRDDEEPEPEKRDAEASDAKLAAAVERARHVLRSHPEGIAGGLDGWVALMGGKAAIGRRACKFLMAKGDAIERREGTSRRFVFKEPPPTEHATNGAGL